MSIVVARDADHGGLAKARANGWLAERQTTKAGGRKVKEWMCMACVSEWKEVATGKGSCYDAFRSHLIHCHDPEHTHTHDDDPEERSPAYACFPEATLAMREKKAAMREKKAAAARAAGSESQAAAPAVPAAAPTSLTLDEAVDALVAAGFKADGVSLAWLTAEVKKRSMCRLLWSRHNQRRSASSRGSSPTLAMLARRRYASVLGDE